MALDKVAGRVIRVGDTTWRTGKRGLPGRKPIDGVRAAVRSAYLRMLLLQGRTRRGLCADDPSQRLIAPAIRRQGVLQNNPAVLAPWLTDGAATRQTSARSPYRSQIINNDEQEVVLASDGYPEVLRNSKGN